MQTNEMKLEYDVAMEDILAFTWFHYENSPFVKRQKLVMQWGIVVVCALLAAVLWFVTGSYRYSIVLVSVGALFALIWQPWYQRYVEKGTIKMCNEGSNQGILGSHQLIITESGLIEKNHFSESKLSWKAVDRIETNEDHTFIYTGAVQAYVIPKAAVTGGDYGSFVAALKQACGSPH